ncbi:conserved hypothetical protein [Talaromyces stipitatus ATCC 10500]|uniref:Saccharopine dehydrogenase NADP binding domain-containing protein n=1 Tax=Talaromyces stipitatus (strain ATCC 10500 / CBS 375.48 / QM 6759 / NRRL 1006) TaxID=441959 RepID=B8LY12_TALSN|nr:uncharacterized protein TSTA_063090 [Talaromyces stipitatus ATCC 10500]EED22827.1 conserved hypothetical protein [Talaromyces stipitatus ATCC 10500]
MSKEFDLVLLGPTGYTGQYTAENIYKGFPTTLKWAVAGRSASKIESLVQKWRQLGYDRPDPEILIVQMNLDNLHALAKRTRLIINCVGPYHLYSTPVVDACAENGTHYVDVTGETPWVRKVLHQYHEIAAKNGAIIIPSCGFESVPPDVVAWYAVNHLRTQLSAEPTEAVGCIYDIKAAGASGGTSYTVISTLESADISDLVKSMDSYCLAASPIPSTRTTPRKSIIETIFGIRSVSDLGTLTSSPSGMVDETTVIRSSTLMSNLYGPNFSYREYFRVRNVLLGAVFHFVLTIGVTLLVFAPFRWIAKRFVPAPGHGPSKEETVNDYSEHRVLVSSNQKDSTTGKMKKVLGSIAYRGDLYGLTGITVSAAAKIVLEHEKEIKNISAGFVTPATLGQAYVDELERGGFNFDVKVLN